MAEFEPWDEPEKVATLNAALRLCRLVEPIAAEHCCHVALTGGCLYKDGGRKDVDLLFYRVRQADKIDVEELFSALAKIGLFPRPGQRFGVWCVKADWDGFAVDCFFPDPVAPPGGDQERGQYGRR